MGILVYNKINLVRKRKNMRLQILKLFKEVILFFALLAYPVCDSIAQLTVNNAPTPNQLVQNVILGPGVQATNVSYTGANDARGSYACINCGLGSGIGMLLSTGSIFLASGPNSSSGSGKSNGLTGDPDLSVLTSPYATQDAAVLEFDFTVDSDSLELKYIFASEEYNQHVNHIFNDVFAFLISGPGYAGAQNLAIVPNSINPLGVSTVNNGQAAAGQNAVGPCANCQYYRDNANPLNAIANIEYDGFTTVLTVRAAVYPCERYHIKLAIADAHHQLFDSGIFIEAGSFQARGDFEITIDTNSVSWIRNDTVFLCRGDTAIFCAPKASNYNWSNGDTTQCIKIAQTGTYSIDMSVGSCIAVSKSYTVIVDTTSITYSPNGPVTIPNGGSVTFCVTGGSYCVWSTGDTAFCITVTVPGSYTASVYTPGGCKIDRSFSASGSATGPAPSVTISCSSVICQGDSAILSVTAHNFSPTGYSWSTGQTSSSIYVSTSGNYHVSVGTLWGWPVMGSFYVSVSNPTVTIAGPTSICQGDSAILAASGPPNSWQWSNGATDQTITVTPGNYSVLISNNYGCTATAHHQVLQSPSPVPSIIGSTNLCLGTNTALTVSSTFSSYAWSSGETTQSINVNTSGTYAVVVTDNNGCTGIDSITVVVRVSPTAGISGSNIICSGNPTQLSASAGFSAYQWSTGSTAQSISVLNPSTYFVTVTDQFGCTGTDSLQLSLHPSPSPNIAGPSKICWGSSVHIVADSNFVQYIWSTGDTTTGIVTGIGSYVVTVTDLNGCTGSAIQQISAHPVSQVSISGVPNVCFGDSAILSASNGFVNYIWSTGDTVDNILVDSSGNYLVTVTDINGCTAIDNFMFSINQVPDPNLSGPSNICDGDTANISASSGWASYNWSNGSTSSTTYATQSC